jgi:CheY-like chemotaxis protein
MAFSDEIDEWLLRWHTRLKAEDQALPTLPDGKSSTFLHDLTPDKSTRPLPVALEGSRDGNSVPTVMIVEDESSAVEQMQSVLNRISTFNYEVYSRAADAIARLQQAVNGQADMPCLIVLDYELPESTGFSVLTYYRTMPELRASTPLIVWSVLDSLTNREMSVWMGAKRFIPKDSGPTTLLKSLTTVLQESRIPPAQTTTVV